MVTYEKLRTLRPGDKVIVTVDDVEDNKDFTLSIKNIGWINNNAVSDIYLKPNRIKMTPKEKKELDTIRKSCNTLLQALICIDSHFPSLESLVFGDGDKSDYAIDLGQLGFAKAWYHPKQIEVVKPAGPDKYYVHLIPNEADSYLNYDREKHLYQLNTKKEDKFYKTKFTKDEIKKIKFNNFEIKDSALEKVSDLERIDY